jgi:hypothetical protein
MSTRSFAAKQRLTNRLASVPTIASESGRAAVLSMLRDLNYDLPQLPGDSVQIICYSMISVGARQPGLLRQLANVIESFDQSKQARSFSAEVRSHLPGDFFALDERMKFIDELSALIDPAQFHMYFSRAAGDACPVELDSAETLLRELEELRSAETCHPLILLTEEVASQAHSSSARHVAKHWSERLADLIDESEPDTRSRQRAKLAAFREAQTKNERPDISAEQVTLTLLAALCSRDSSGRLLQPAHRIAAAKPAAPPAASCLAPSPVPGVTRRWALASGPRGDWQFVPGDSGPELRRVSPETAVDISHLRAIGASVALSADARVVAELNRGRLALAWVDRVLPRLDSWPGTFKLALGDEARLLAVAVGYGGDAVTCLLSTGRATYQADVSPGEDEPLVTEVLGEPSKCAVIVSGRVLNVDQAGRLRGWELNLSSRGVAVVDSLDAARSAGRVVYAVAGRDGTGKPVFAWGSSLDALTVLPGTPADEVSVVRQMSGAVRPGPLLLSRGDLVDRVSVGDLT